MISIKELDDISLFNRKKRIDMTDYDWQIYFNELRNKIKPSSERHLKSSGSISINGYNDFSQFTYCGDTQWQYYCKFINSVLSTIRSGECDYCYHIYQISDLLKFEHDKLKTEWLPKQQCFKVSLTNKN